MMAITATRVVFHPAAFAAAWVALIALLTSAALLLISNLLPPICLSTQVKLVMASRSFLVVLVCGCAHHTSPIRRDVWIIQHRGKLFPNRLGIARKRPGACSVMSGVIVDSRGISGAAIGMRGYVSGYGRRLESNDMGNEKPPQGVALRGLVVVVRSGQAVMTTRCSSPPRIPHSAKPLAVSIRSMASSGESPKMACNCWNRHTRCLSRQSFVIVITKLVMVPCTRQAVPLGRLILKSTVPLGRRAVLTAPLKTLLL